MIKLKNLVAKSAIALSFMTLLTGCGADKAEAATVEQSTPKSVVTTTVQQPNKVQKDDDTSSNNWDQAVALVNSLTVKGRASKTGYSRDQFGEAWYDLDGNGCDTRNDILARDLTNKNYKDSCVILSGTLIDPYGGETINFVRGQKTSSAVQIDHVVALSDAWQKGAQQLSEKQRLQFANDPLNLIAVDGPLNQQKSDGDAATWLPPQKSFRCEYVYRQAQVKAKYNLWVTATEQTAMLNVLNNCSKNSIQLTNNDVLVPTNTNDILNNVVVNEPTNNVSPVKETTNEVNLVFKNCSEVRAAGRAPIKVGEPGFESKFDRDGDGIGCE